MRNFARSRNAKLMGNGLTCWAIGVYLLRRYEQAANEDPVLRRVQTIPAQEVAPDPTQTAPEASGGPSGVERRRHPRVNLNAAAMPDPAQPAPEADSARSGIERRRHPRVSMESGGEAPTPDPEVIERRRQHRRSVDALRAELEWTAAPDEKSWNRGSRKVKSSRLALLFVALISGGLAAYMAVQNGNTAETAAVEPTVQIVPEVHDKILVASRSIGVGQRLTADAIEWRDWPKDSVLDDYITFEATPDALADMSGSVARFQIFPGDPIRSGKIVKASQGYLSAVLDEGKRGVSVSVSAEAASGGFVSPNDHVDVVLTRNISGNEVTDTILRNVRVLAIDTRLGDAGSTDASSEPADTKPETFSNQAIATLELEPARAEMIIRATALGRLSLVLRSAADSAGAEPSEQADLDQAIRLSSPFWTASDQTALR